MADPCRRDIARGPEADEELTGGNLELRLHQTRLTGQFGHLKGAAPPGLDQTAAIEGLGDEWIPWARAVRPGQVLWGQPEMEGAGAGDFQTIIEYGNADRPAAYAIVAVAEGIGQRLAQRGRGIERVIDAFEEVGSDPAGHRQVVAQKTLRPAQQVEGVAHFLPVVEEFTGVVPPEAGHAQQALGVLRSQPLSSAEEDNGGIEQCALVNEAESHEQLAGRG